jgi:hypothetical protein
MFRFVPNNIRRLDINTRSFTSRLRAVGGGVTQLWCVWRMAGSNSSYLVLLQAHFVLSDSRLIIVLAYLIRQYMTSAVYISGIQPGVREDILGGT